MGSAMAIAGCDALTRSIAQWAGDAGTFGPPWIHGAGDPPSGPIDLELVTLLAGPAFAVAAFVWGTLWASFANVVIWRVPRGESVVYPGSKCGQCGKPIAWYDNLPIVSYLVLAGRCRACETRYSPRYLIVELIGGAMCLALWRAEVVLPLIEGSALLPALVGFFAWQIFCFALLIVAYVDLDLWIIPDEVVLPVGLLGLVLAAIEPTWLGVELGPALAAALGGFVLVFLLRALYLWLRGVEALGLGDGKLLLMVGAFLGPLGLLWTVGAGAMQGLLVSVPMLALGKKVASTDLREIHGDDPLLGDPNDDDDVMGARVPFGPFLALAALEWAFAREWIERAGRWLLG